jgi:hypothetical protein
MRRVPARSAGTALSTGTGQRRTAALLALVVAAIVLLTGVPSPAPAAPSATDPEGGTPALRQALADASRGYADARGKLLASQKRQAELVRRQKETEARAAVLGKDVNALAKAAYRDGRPNMLTAMLNSQSVPTLFGKSELIDQLSTQNNAKITALAQARTALAQQRRQLTSEIALQSAQERAMAKRKADAERALGTSSTAGFSSSGNLPAAKAAKRNADGSFSSQSCSVDDPTTSGCLTPRTLSALQQAKAAGFTRFVACFRQASFGEHPKGRACDFSAAPGTFGGVRRAARQLLRRQRGPARRAVRDLVQGDLASRHRLAGVQQRQRRPRLRPHEPCSPVGAVALTGAGGRSSDR